MSKHTFQQGPTHKNFCSARCTTRKKAQMHIKEMLALLMVGMYTKKTGKTSKIISL